MLARFWQAHASALNTGRVPQDPQTKGWIPNTLCAVLLGADFAGFVFMVANAQSNIETGTGIAYPFYGFGSVRLLCEVAVAAYLVSSCSHVMRAAATPASTRRVAIYLMSSVGFMAVNGVAAGLVAAGVYTTPYTSFATTILIDVGRIGTSVCQVKIFLSHWPGQLLVQRCCVRLFGRSSGLQKAASVVPADQAAGLAMMDTHALRGAYGLILQNIRLKAAQKEREARIDRNNDAIALHQERQGLRLQSLELENVSLKTMYDQIANDIRRNERDIENQTNNLAAEMHLTHVMAVSMTTAMGAMRLIEEDAQHGDSHCGCVLCTEHLLGLKYGIEQLRTGVTWCYQKDLFVAIHQKIYELPTKAVILGMFLARISEAYDVKVESTVPQNSTYLLDLRILELIVIIGVSNAKEHGNPWRRPWIDVAVETGLAETDEPFAERCLVFKVINEAQPNTVPLTNAEKERCLTGRRQMRESVGLDLEGMRQGKGLPSAVAAARAAKGTLRLLQFEMTSLSSASGRPSTEHSDSEKRVTVLKLTLPL